MINGINCDIIIIINQITDYGDTVKRIITFCIALLFVFNTMISAFAAEAIDFSLYNVECNVNRLIDIDVVATSRQNLSAVTIEFTYDKSMFEFRETTSADTNASVKSNETDKCVKAVYLCADGANINNGKTIFTITLKAIKAGTGYIDFNVIECVDKNVEFMQIGSCTSAKVTVNSSSHNNKNDDKSSDNADNSSDNNKSSNGKSVRNEATTSLSTADNLGTLNQINDNKANYIFIGVLIGFGIVIILSFAFLFGRKTASIKNNNK